MRNTWSSTKISVYHQNKEIARKGQENMHSENSALIKQSVFLHSLLFSQLGNT